MKKFILVICVLLALFTISCFTPEYEQISYNTINQMKAKALEISRGFELKDPISGQTRIGHEVREILLTDSLKLQIIIDFAISKVIDIPLPSWEYDYVKYKISLKDLKTEKLLDLTNHPLGKQLKATHSEQEVKDVLENYEKYLEEKQKHHPSP